MLVDLMTAKQHLRRDDNDDDGRIQLTIDHASYIVLKYLKIDQGSYQSTGGDPDDVPPDVHRAVLRVTENLYDNPDEDPISDDVVSILMRSRDPAMS